MQNFNSSVTMQYMHDQSPKKKEVMAGGLVTQATYWQGRIIDPQFHGRINADEKCQVTPTYTLGFHSRKMASTNPATDIRQELADLIKKRNEVAVSPALRLMFF